MRKLLGLLLAAMLILVACGGGDTSEPLDDAAQEQPAIEVEVGDFFFEPSTLQGEAGQELTLTITNEGEAPHTFTLSDQDVDEELQPGDEVEVSVVVPDSGSVEFVCRFHSGQGMKGTLEVAS